VRPSFDNEDWSAILPSIVEPSDDLTVVELRKKTDYVKIMAQKGKSRGTGTLMITTVFIRVALTYCLSAEIDLLELYMALKREQGKSILDAHSSLYECSLSFFFFPND